ncbi:hypothetical protein [Siminovitchia sp. 179-K 8D1 HS]|uniref:hypothetical protein n=1 Tax=Siminovitchia sp. 179-K 8D1 HS TaxID=3142385 RepID=UPI0039A13625
MNENFKLNQLYNAYECGNLSFYNTVKYQIEPDEVIERYQTLCSAFMFPIAGRAIITLDNTEFEAKPGTMIYVPPSVITEYDKLYKKS